MTDRPLVEEVDALVCDIDGVVCAGDAAIEHAVTALRSVPLPIVFATNNASRSPAEIVRHLHDLGVPTREEAVLTSSVVAADYLARELPPGSEVMAVGGKGVGIALRAVGLVPRAPGDRGDPVAVLQGYGPGVSASDLAEVAHAVRGGAWWVATNDDLTLPTERGPAPGNGSLVRAVRGSVDRDPLVIGKPHPPMYELAATVLGAPPQRILAVGDRLETDIEGAVRTGMSGALVLTGVHGPADAAAAPPERRPRYVISDLRGLLEDYPEPRTEGAWSLRGAARARLESDLVVEGEGIDTVRAALDAVWAAVDAGRLTSDEAGRLLDNG